jgi:hypothetical protein
MEFNDKISREFRHYARNFLTRHEKEQVCNFEVHHIMPVRFGGTNDYDNLALVNPDLHKLLHVIIDSQLNGLRHISEYRNIRLPYMQSKVWGLT